MENTENLCRICLETSSTTYKFSDNITNFDKVFEYFEDFTKIKIKEVDSKICLQCFMNLKFSHEFKKKCLLNNSKYEELFERAESSEYDEVVVKQEVVYEEPEILLVNDVNFDSSVKQEYPEAPEPEPETVQQPILKVKKSKAKKPGRKQKLKDLEGPFFCSFCGKEYKNYTSLTSHERQTHLNWRIFSCDLCGKEFNNKPGMRDHILKHIGVRNFHCSKCTSSFIVKEGLRNHMKYVHRLIPKNVQCPHCEMRCFTQAHLKVHIKTHFKMGSNERFKCQLCPKSFGTKHYLEYHIEEHENKFLRVCKVCKEEFTTISMWQRHYKIHNQKGKVMEQKKKLMWKCPVEDCGKEFITKLWLDEHKTIHTGDRNFRCTVEGCRQTFRVQKTLVRHIYTVHHKMTFNCEICQLTMPLKSRFQRNYITHVRDFHSNLGAERLHELEEKIKTLRFKDVSNEVSEELHEIGVKTIKSTKCSLCYINFRSNQMLIQHMKTFHEECSEIKEPE